MARAAVAAGADGLLIEVHVRPEEALSDGAQTLDPVEFAQLMHEVGPITQALGRRLAVLPSESRVDAGTPERLRAAHGD